MHAECYTVCIQRGWRCGNRRQPGPRAGTSGRDRETVPQMAIWTIEVRRPSGEIETVAKEDPRNLVQIIEVLRRATREAGRGEILTVNRHSKAPARPKFAPRRRGCAQYSYEDGCPLHGEGCA